MIATCAERTLGMMISIVSFIEIENRVISAIYRNLMIRARVVLVDKASGEQLADPVITIASPAPAGALRIKLPQSVEPGTYFLRALNGRGEYAAKSAEFEVG